MSPLRDDQSPFRYVGWRVATYAFCALVAVLAGFGLGAYVEDSRCPEDGECGLVFLAGVGWSLVALLVALVTSAAVEVVVRRRARRTRRTRRTRQTT